MFHKTDSPGNTRQNRKPIVSCERVRRPVTSAKSESNSITSILHKKYYIFYFAFANSNNGKEHENFLRYKGNLRYSYQANIVNSKLNAHMRCKNKAHLQM